MRQLSMDYTSGKIIIGDHAIPLLAGEVHYWQHQQMAWRDILKAIKDSGLDMVSIRPAWEYHEPEQGVFDFHGHTAPERDLALFLEMCEEEGLWIFLRLAVFSRPAGPWVHVYWKRGGTPAYASDRHRLHPEFLGYAQRYINSLGHVLNPHSANAGGRLVLIQCENEVIFDPSPKWSDQTLNGPLGEPGTYRTWCREKYGTVHQLNVAWGTSYTDFDDIMVLPKSEVYDLKSFTHFSDRLRYQEWYVEQCADAMVTMVRSAGIDVLTVLNTDPRYEPQHVTQLQAKVDLVGADYWYANLMPRSQVVEYAAHVKYLESSVRLAWSPEFMSNTAANHVDLEKVNSPYNGLYLGILGMIFGLRGWTWFMYVERSGHYFTPIDYWGQPNEPHFSLYKELHRIFHTLDWSACQRLSNVGLIWYRPHVWLGPDQPWSARNDWEKMRSDQGRSYGHYSEDELNTGWYKVLQSLLDRDIDFDVFNPESPYNRLQPAPGNTLLYTGPNFMDEESQRVLRGFCEAGGHLIFLSSPPRQNLAGNPTDYFPELPAPISVGPWQGTVDLLEVPSDQLSMPIKLDTSYLAFYPPLTNATRQWSHITGCVGYSVSIGSGQATVLGFEPTADALSELLDRLHCKSYSRSADRDVLTCLALDPKDAYVLLAMNTSHVAKEVTVQLSEWAPDGARWDTTVAEVVHGSGSSQNVAWNSQGLQVTMAPKSGSIMRLQSQRRRIK